MKKILISSATVLSLSIPLFVLAAEPRLTGYLGTAISQGTTLLRQLLTFLIALAVVWFIWNVVRYAMAEDEGGKEKAKSQMIWGIIAIAAIVSIWGIVGLLRYAFGVEGNDGAPTNIEQMIPGGSSGGGSVTPSSGGFNTIPG